MLIDLEILKAGFHMITMTVAIAQKIKLCPNDVVKYEIPRMTQTNKLPICKSYKENGEYFTKHSITVLTKDNGIPCSKFERTGRIHCGTAKTVAKIQGVRIKQQTRWPYTASGRLCKKQKASYTWSSNRSWEMVCLKKFWFKTNSGLIFLTCILPTGCVFFSSKIFLCFNIWTSTLLHTRIHLKGCQSSLLYS